MVKNSYKELKESNYKREARRTAAKQTNDQRTQLSHCDVPKPMCAVTCLAIIFGICRTSTKGKQGELLQNNQTIEDAKNASVTL